MEEVSMDDIKNLIKVTTRLEFETKGNEKEVQEADESIHKIRKYLKLRLDPIYSNR